MVAQLVMVISENNKVIESVVKSVDTQPACMVKSLEKFQQLANTALTRMVECCGNSGAMEAEDEEASDEDEANDIDASPEKKRK